MGTLKEMTWQVLNKIRLGAFIQLRLRSTLSEDGWFDSFHTKYPVNKDGDPIPPCTYPYLKFIENRLTKKMSVFEFGSGNSTLWYAKRVKEIQAVEYNPERFEYFAPILPDNTAVAYATPQKPQYCRAAGNGSKLYDIIIIDGKDRNNCAKKSIRSLKSNGVIVFNNSERDEYTEGVHYLLGNNFKKIDFAGMSPMRILETTTSIFYRDNNNLGI